MANFYSNNLMGDRCKNLFVKRLTNGFSTDKEIF